MVRWSLLAHDSVAVSVPSAGHHPLWEASAIAFAPLYTGFSSRLCRVAGVVRSHFRRLRLLYWIAGRPWCRLHLALLGYHQFRTFRARIEQLDQSGMFLLGDRQFPGALDGNPVDGVLAPVGSVFRFPLVRSTCALGTVRAGRDGDQVLRILQVVGVLLPSIG